MNISKIMALICAELMAMGMTACGGAKEEPVKTYIPSSENVKPLGRTLLTDDMLWLAFSGSGAEFTVSGTKAEIVIAGDDNAEKPDNEDDQARIAIYVNGERVVDDMIDHAEETYTVFESETPAECDIKVVKLSETTMSTCAVKSITVEGGEIKPAEKKEHFIEFVGDSITCGYGVDDEVKEHHFSTVTEDVTKTYAYKTAEALDADYSMVSISGYGIISGYSDGKKKVANQQLPKYYDKLGNCYGTFKGRKVSSEIWDFTGYTPDVIVVNLGTNDESYTKNKEDRIKDYTDSYVEFLKAIRSHNPDSQIICTLGIMGNGLYPYVEQAVETYTGETGDTKVIAMPFDVQSPDDGYAADWHPTEATHAKAAEKLTAQIKETMGW
ncbi:MAG: GDSL-type esterase/lipase family protein [Huintestinicola sp.]